MKTKDFITKKELFENLVRLDEKLDAITDKNAKNVHRFDIFVFWIYVLLIINIIVHVMSFL